MRMMMKHHFLKLSMALSIFLVIAQNTPADAQPVQRECRPQVVRTDFVLVNVPQFPEVYNARAVEVACCDTDGGNAMSAGEIYVQIQPGRRETDPPISCSGGTPILVAQDIAGPAGQGDAPSGWPFIRRSTFFQAINRLAGWNGQAFVGVAQGQMIEFACVETANRSLRVALIDCPCGVNSRGHCEPNQRRLDAVRPPTAIVPGQPGANGIPGNTQVVPQSPVAPTR